MLLLHGEKIELRPMTEDEKEIFFRWATSSDATPFWYGALYGDEVPTRKKFLASWKNHYFNDSAPRKGRCFMIMLEGRAIGQVNYNNIDADGKTELDIIIADSRDLGKGYGPDAIRTLSKYLFEKMNVKEAWIAVLKKNPRAVSAYRKSGFDFVSHEGYAERNPYYWKKRNLQDYFFMSLRKK